VASASVAQARPAVGRAGVAEGGVGRVLSHGVTFSCLPSALLEQELGGDPVAAFGRAHGGPLDDEELALLARWLQAAPVR